MNKSISEYIYNWINNYEELEVDDFYNNVGKLERNQLVDFMWLIFSHIECNELYDDFYDTFKEFCTDIMGAEIYD